METDISFKNVLVNRHKKGVDKSEFHSGGWTDSMAYTEREQIATLFHWKQFQIIYPKH